MDFTNVLRVVRRWPWLILSVVVVTLLVLFVRLRTTEHVFNAKMELQLTTPLQEDVTLYDHYRSSSLQDDMTVARNNLTEVLQSKEVHDRTSKALNLSDDEAVYLVDVEPVRDSNFIYVTISARTPALAQAIANAHASAAIAYYGEIRAKPATATSDFIATQLTAAQEELRVAEQSFTNFKVKHDISTLDNELARYRDLIQQLQEERNRRMLEGPTSLDIQTTQQRIEQLQLSRETALAQGNTELAKGFDDAIARNQAQLADLLKNTSPTDHIDKVIAVRQRELETLLGYESDYNDLDMKVQQSQAKYQLLLTKSTEALLQENDIKTSNYIQIVAPAVAPNSPVPTNTKGLLVLAFFGSLGVGVILAFVLDYLVNQSASTSIVIPQPAIRTLNGYSSQQSHRPNGSSKLNGVVKPRRRSNR